MINRHRALLLDIERQTRNQTPEEYEQSRLEIVRRDFGIKILRTIEVESIDDPA